MPSKTCPKCKKKHGSRKKVCECGHKFSGGKHPLSPEPGGWVIDKTKGLPLINPPEPLPKGKLTNRDVQDYVAYEGLGFSVYSLIPSSKIKDRKLAQLWKKARGEMQKIVEYLETCNL